MKGKVALITGAAGGIGSAISRRLAGAGASMVLLYRNNLAGARALLAGLPAGEHRLVRADVIDSESLAAAAEVVRAQYGRLDVLVNNAGITRAVPHADLDALDDALIDAIFATNWRGAFASARAFRGLLAAGGDGLIVNISSVAGVTGMGSNVAYCASKAALDSLTRSLARALAPAIRVLSVSPGFVDGEYARKMDPALIAEQVARTPLRRLALADDVGDAVLAAATLLKDTTGVMIPVDGGRPLGN